MLTYLAEITVNQPHGAATVETTLEEKLAGLPAARDTRKPPSGSRQLLLELGPEQWAQELRAQQAVAVTDTTLRDAHQSLLATRVRSKDLLAVAPAMARLLPGPTGAVYRHEIPGGQLSNLRQQAKALGLGGRFEAVTDMYAHANRILGNIVKVTPSSKVVGDLALVLG